MHLFQWDERPIATTEFTDAFRLNSSVINPSKFDLDGQHFSVFKVVTIDLVKSLAVQIIEREKCIRHSIPNCFMFMIDFRFNESLIH